jgi:Cd2+/Zn2+-exporting ATPase
VLTGEGHINEASITGEAVPVSKKKDSGVYAGTILKMAYCKSQLTV